jgi:hypothetical protein
VKTQFRRFSESLKRDEEERAEMIRRSRKEAEERKERAARGEVEKEDSMSQ